MKSAQKVYPERSRRGFTLVELLIVIAIIAILSAIAMVVFSGIQKSARDSKRRSDIEALAQAVRMYALSNKSFPAFATTPCSDDFANWNDTSNPNSLINKLQPYIQNFPLDPLNGTTKCGFNNNFTCRYCYAVDMWCKAGFSGPSCSAGIAAVYGYQEACSIQGDAERFGYGNCNDSTNQNIFVKSVDPI